MAERGKNKLIALVVLIIVILFGVGFNYDFLDDELTGFLIENEIAVVERIVDGDTIQVEDIDGDGAGEKVRLLGINTPERGEEYYKGAGEFLGDLILNKSVELEYGKSKTDRYGRLLAYVFLNGENVNLKVVEEGYANYYFPSGKDHYYNGFADAWKKCTDEGAAGLCEKSDNSCSECILLKEFEHEREVVVLYNTGDNICDLTGWTIKDEGRKKFVFENFILDAGEEVSIIVGDGEDSEKVLYWEGEDYVWTKSGDTLFLRDDENKLVLWRSY